MTYIELARIYLVDEGISETTYLERFEYRKGKTADDVANALIKAEAHIKDKNLVGASELSEIAYQLGRVLKQRRIYGTGANR